MKKLFLLSIMLLGLTMTVQAQVQKHKTMVSEVKADGSTKAENIAVIKFDSTRVNFGKFPSSKPIQSCTFTFTNTGTAPLIINQCFASCGCTTPDYPKNPIKPGEKGAIKVTYNGKDRFPGHFQKTVTVRTNTQNDITRLIIEGTMTE